MWVLIFFDIAILRRKDIVDLERFKNFLYNNEFYSLQHSVYAARKSREELNELKHIIKNHLPEHGKIDFLYITEDQFENIESFYGKRSLHVVNSYGRQIDLFQN